MHAQPLFNSQLLSLCSILRWFDGDLLQLLAPEWRDDVAPLLASTLVQAVGGRAGAYVLRPEVLPVGLSQQELIALHTRAFQHYLQRLEADAPAQHALEDELECFYHLNTLFFPLAQGHEWDLLCKYWKRASATVPRHPRHRQQLTLYDGYIAIHLKDYARGHLILSELCEQPDLDPDAYCHALNARAHGYLHQDDFDRAAQLYEQLTAVAEQMGHRQALGLALVNFGMVCNELEEYERALDLSRRSLAIFTELGDQARLAFAVYAVGLNEMALGHWLDARRSFSEATQRYETLQQTALLGHIAWSLGYLNHMLGNEHESESYLLSALSYARLAKDRFVEIDALLDLGFLNETCERWPTALELYRHALQLSLDVGKERRISQIYHRIGSIYYAQGLLGEASAAYAQAIESIESLSQAASREQIKMSLYGSTQQIYEAMVLLCLERKQCDLAFNYVERARSRAFLETLVKRAPELYTSAAHPVLGLDEVQLRLPSETLLLAYYTTGVTPKCDHMLNHLPPENERVRRRLVLPPRSLVFAITRTSYDCFRLALDPNRVNPDPEQVAPVQRLLKQRTLTYLYDCLLGPVEHLIAESKQIYLVPHGPLHYVPFMALCSAEGAPLVRAEGPAIAFAPNATILLSSCLGRRPTPSSELLALGYSGGAPGLAYPDLEANLVARLCGGTAYVGSAPKSQLLLEEDLAVGSLHIAAHCTYLAQAPLESALHLGAGDVLSAIAVIESFALRTDLVVLSACSSGLSQVVSGDELLGLQRAFLQAGVPAIIGALWETRDLVALTTMFYFYTGLRQGLTAAPALRDALVEVRQITKQQLFALIRQWQRELPPYAALLDELLEQESDAPDVPFADADVWAPFLLIGRA